MPLYDMECQECKHKYEVFASMQDGPDKKCPACGKKKAKQVFEKPPAYHGTYSPMHPRANRGRGH